MDDLIERQSSRDVIFNDLVANNSEYTLDFKRGMAYASSLLILEPPAMDAVDVVHAEWTDSPNGETMCTHCHYENITGLLKEIATCFEPFPKYCPNCGARMDGQRREEGSTK